MDLVEASACSYEVGARHPWERARLGLVQRLIAAHVDIGSGDTVVDIGCGDTYVIEQLARARPDVRFLAVDSAFTPELIDRLRARLTVANVELFDSLDGIALQRPAALVLLMDVIEHVADDVAFLGDICGRTWVGPRTSVLITVPAYQALFSAHDRFLGHYRRYSAPQLDTLVACVGLRRLLSTHVFATLVPLRLLALVRERLAGVAPPTSGVATWEGGEAMSRGFAALLSLDGRIGLALGRLGLRLPGLSLFALCRRSA